MTTPPRTLLAFDYGRQRIGVAVGQELTGSARALTTLHSVKEGPDWPAILKLVKDWQPAALIVGLPCHADGTEHQITQEVRHFAAELQQKTGLPVYFVDEHLTSIEAEGLLSAAGRRRQPHTKAAKAEVDKLAAQLILQTWLGNK